MKNIFGLRIVVGKNEPKILQKPEGRINPLRLELYKQLQKESRPLDLFIRIFVSADQYSQPGTFGSGACTDEDQ